MPGRVLSRTDHGRTNGRRLVAESLREPTQVAAWCYSRGVRIPCAVLLLLLAATVAEDDIGKRPGRRGK
jgi:hypothetical protein